MKRLILLIFIILIQGSYSLEISKIIPVNNIRLMNKQRIYLPGASEVWVKGKPGREVEMTINGELSAGNKRSRINFDKIHLKDKKVTLDRRGNGRFIVSIRVTGEGSGRIEGGIPIEVNYVN